jgi:hypothetical protein
MKVIVRSVEPENERRRSLIQSNTGFVGLRDFLLDGAGRTARALVAVVVRAWLQIGSTLLTRS